MLQEPSLPCHLPCLSPSCDLAYLLPSNWCYCLCVCECFSRLFSMWLSALEDKLRGPLALCPPGGSTEMTLHEQGLSKSAHALLMSAAFQDAAPLLL